MALSENLSDKLLTTIRQTVVDLSNPSLQELVCNYVHRIMNKKKSRHQIVKRFATDWLEEHEDIDVPIQDIVDALYSCKNIINAPPKTEFERLCFRMFRKTKQKPQLDTVRDNIIQTLRQHKINVIEPTIGTRFDPKLHCGLSVSPNQNRKNHLRIAKVVNRGIAIGNNIITKPSVVVWQYQESLQGANDE